MVWCKKKLRWICFLLLVILPLIYLLSWGRLCSRVLMTTAAPCLITGWRLVAYGAKMEDDGCVPLWNADQNKASHKVRTTTANLPHFTALDSFPTWTVVGLHRAHWIKIQGQRFISILFFFIITFSCCVLNNTILASTQPVDVFDLLWISFDMLLNFLCTEVEQLCIPR